MVQGWRRRIVLLLVVYVLAMVVWAFRPWSDTRALVTPEGEPQAFATFECPSVFGSGGEDRPEVPYPPVHEPCGEQGRHRVLFAVDIAAAGVGIALLTRNGTRRRAADQAHEAEAVALEASGA